MAALLIKPTDVLEVQHLPLLLYGPPGCGKTSLAQTAATPLTLDFDKGLHRAFNRKTAMRFDTWGDCLEEQGKGTFKAYSTIVLDTLGALLDAIAREVMAESAKHTQGGGLSIQGWGVLGNRFSQWVRQLVASGQDVVMLCHEQEDKDVSGNRYLRPAMPGNMAYATVHRLIDIMGHIKYDGRVRWLDFSPTDQAIGKNAAGWEPIKLGRLEDQPLFLAELLLDAKGKIGKTAEASAALAKTVQEWVVRLDGCTELPVFNKAVKEALKLGPGPLKNQVWHQVLTVAQAAGWTLNKEAKQFAAKEVAA